MGKEENVLLYYLFAEIILISLQLSIQIERTFFTIFLIKDEEDYNKFVFSAFCSGLIITVVGLNKTDIAKRRNT